MSLLPPSDKTTRLVNFSQSKLVKFILVLLVGLCVVYILQKINLDDIVAILLQLPAIVFVKIFIIAFAAICIRAYKWYLLLGSARHYFTFREILCYQFVGIFWGWLTPGKLGEHGKAWYIHKKVPGLLAGVFTTVIDRVADLAGFALTAIFVLGAFFFFEHSQLIDELFTYLVIGSIAAGFGAILVFLIYFKSNFFTSMWHMSLKEKITKVLFAISFRKWAIVFGLTFLFWAIQLLMYNTLAQDFNSSLSAFHVSVAALVAILATTLPISINGVGTREASLVFVFELFGGDPHIAIALGLTILATNIIAGLVGCGCYFFLKFSNKATDGV